MKKTLPIFISFGFVFILFFSFCSTAKAEYQRAALGNTIVIGEFVFDDDYVATTTAGCTITIYDPAGTQKVNAGSMTSDATGWTHYSYAIGAGETEGNWHSIMSCGSVLSGDLVKVDKTFTVGAVVVASSTIANAVWNNTTRTLSAFGSLASDVWNSSFASTRRLTDSTLTDGGSLPTYAQFNSATSTIVTEILANRTLISNLNNISASDVWSNGARTLTDYATTSIASSTAYEVWNRASSQLTSTGSVGKLVADNIDVAISTRGTSDLSASDVWNAATRTLSDYATSSIASYAATAVWANAARTLTDYGNDVTAAQIWNTLTSSLTTVNSIGKLLTDNVDTAISTRASLANQIAGWSIVMSDYSAVETGETYRAKIVILNSNSVPTTPFATPTVTLYDSERNTTVSDVAMTAIGTGVYEYTYSVASGASQGVWETVISTQVESGKTLTNNDYWIVAGSPAQVIINSVTANSISDISANVTITNEGLAGYEYHYEWCVVSSIDNPCGDGDDSYHGTGAKFINPSEDWNTNLTATVSSAGDYYFKMIVYFGTESSGSSRTFTVASSGGEEEGNGGGGGGGGGGGSSSGGTCAGADFNGDYIVNSVDFSILLAFWKTNSPFANTCVDINHDNVVNSVDFSILLSQWGTSGHVI